MGAQQKAQTKVQIVVRALEVDIVLGRLYPRERLVRETLARRFETTRHVIRQALNELEIAGVLICSIRIIAARLTVGVKFKRNH